MDKAETSPAGPPESPGHDLATPLSPIKARPSEGTFSVSSSFPAKYEPRPDLPGMHYLTDNGGARRISENVVARTVSVPTLPPDFPFAAPSVASGQRYVIGWLEFCSSDEPDPEVARPGDVWIQLPSESRADSGRVFVCYAAAGRAWTVWEGDAAAQAYSPSVGVHPLLIPARQTRGGQNRARQYRLVFDGSDFTWVNGKRLAALGAQWRSGAIPAAAARMAQCPGPAAFLTPAEAVVEWSNRQNSQGSPGKSSGPRGKIRKANTPYPPSPPSLRATKRLKSDGPATAVVSGGKDPAPHSSSQPGPSGALSCSGSQAPIQSITSPGQHLPPILPRGEEHVVQLPSPSSSAYSPAIRTDSPHGTHQRPGALMQTRDTPIGLGKLRAAFFPTPAPSEVAGPSREVVRSYSPVSSATETPTPDSEEGRGDVKPEELARAIEEALGQIEQARGRMSAARDEMTKAEDEMARAQVSLRSALGTYSRIAP
ncbi:hypothetical protein BC834DRAFT_630633 [Gloeopeniophorella convolvens]|nr:hypothetical protein BC834DRAFT_630633 [Gloeopeniophorella convolvens]